MGQTTEALLYLMPRSLDTACCCSPSVTQCELERVLQLPEKWGLDG